MTPAGELEEEFPASLTTEAATIAMACQTREREKIQYLSPCLQQCYFSTITTYHPLKGDFNTICICVHVCVFNVWSLLFSAELFSGHFVQIGYV